MAVAEKTQNVRFDDGGSYLGNRPEADAYAPHRNQKDDPLGIKIVIP